MPDRYYTPRLQRDLISLFYHAASAAAATARRTLLQRGRTRESAESLGGMRRAGLAQRASTGPHS